MPADTRIFADEIAALMPERRIGRLRDEEDAKDLAAILAHAFGVGTLAPEIARIIWARALFVTPEGDS